VSPFLGPGNLAVDGNATSRVFHITNGVTVTISSLTISNGFADGLNFPDFVAAASLTITRR